MADSPEIQRDRHRRADAEGQRLRHHLERAVIAAPPGRREFDQHGAGAAELAAGRKALDQPRQQQQQRRRNADRAIGRQQAKQAGAGRHQQDHHDQRLLAAVLVGVEPEHQPAQRPCREGDAEGGECQQQRRIGIFRRKEQLAENSRKQAEHREVEPLQRIADGRGNHDPTAHLRRDCSLHRWVPSTIESRFERPTVL